MKMLSLLGFFVLAVFSFTSCKKNDTAPFEGFYNVEPIKVTQLEKGEEYNFAPVDFSAHPDAALQIKMHRDTANCSTWYVYLVGMDGSLYLLSGYGANGVSYYVTDHHYSTTSGKINIIIKLNQNPEHRVSCWLSIS